MSRTHSIYVCQQCGYQSPTYLGRCPQCDSWNSFIESLESGVKSQGKTSRLSTLATSDLIINLSDIQKTDYKRLDTGLEEFNRVLGGGVVVGSLVLVSGDPGIGKSTLLTQLALNINSVGADLVSARSEKGRVPFESPQGKQDPPLQMNSVLYVAGEESARQIKIRVDRISPKVNLAVLNDTDVDNIVAAVEAVRPGLVIVDSIQTLVTADLESVAGSIGQVRECAHRLQLAAKKLHIPIFIVGHVTKEGNLAGPKTLEHMVDVVLSLEGEQTSSFRILRTSKNRFGPTDEIGVFEMQESGMIEVKNPSKLFLDQKVQAPGSAVTATLNGFRPILVEIQALVSKSFLPIPRRVGSGIDNNRLQLLVAVLQSRMKLPLFDKDIFVNVTGGLKVTEPAADLAICLAIASSLKEVDLSPKTMITGEVGLLGEVREVRGIEKRTTEANKLGFTKVVSAANAKSLAQAMKLVFQ